MLGPQPPTSTLQAGCIDAPRPCSPQRIPRPCAGRRAGRPARGRRPGGAACGRRLAPAVAGGARSARGARPPVAHAFGSWLGQGRGPMDTCALGRLRTAPYASQALNRAAGAPRAPGAAARLAGRRRSACMTRPAAGAGPRPANAHRPELGSGPGLSAVSEDLHCGRAAPRWCTATWCTCASPTRWAQSSPRPSWRPSRRARAAPAAVACAVAPVVIRRVVPPQLQAVRAPVRVEPAKGGRCVWGSWGRWPATMTPGRGCTPGHLPAGGAARALAARRAGPPGRRRRPKRRGRAGGASGARRRGPRSGGRARRGRWRGRAGARARQLRPRAPAAHARGAGGGRGARRGRAPAAARALPAGARWGRLAPQRGAGACLAGPERPRLRAPGRRRRTCGRAAPDARRPAARR